jgi:hypothetical protein
LSRAAEHERKGLAPYFCAKVAGFYSLTQK